MAQELTSFLGSGGTATATPPTPAPVAQPETPPAPVAEQPRPRPRIRMVEPQHPVAVDRPFDPRSIPDDEFQIDFPGDAKPTETPVVSAQPAVNPFASVAAKLGLPAETLAAMKPQELAEFTVAMMERTQEQQQKFLGEYKQLVESVRPQVQPAEPPAADPFQMIQKLVEEQRLDQDFAAPVLDLFSRQNQENAELKKTLSQLSQDMQAIKSRNQEEKINEVDRAFAAIKTHNTILGETRPAQNSPEYFRRVAVLQSLQAKPIPGLSMPQQLAQRAAELFPMVAATPVQSPIQKRQEQWRENGTLAAPSRIEAAPLDEHSKSRMEFKNLLKTYVAEEN